ncbi:gliding motility protein GldM [Wandonia haliotis]|uniref:Gliding motility protein GldM n=1 Tax=Wandonia haliotis TaxID=574963 RepID=A0ABN1MMN2_9FLAO
MAGGKETPRQKMIGMMYLVLTALLALNVSKEIISAFVTINDKLDLSGNVVQQGTKTTYGEFDAKRLGIQQQGGDLKAFEFWNNKAKAVNKRSRQLVHFILSESNAMIEEAEKQDWIAEKDDDGLIVELKPLFDISAMDNYDIPTNRFIGSNPMDPKEEGRRLRDSIIAFRDFITQEMATYPMGDKKYSFKSPSDTSKLNEALKSANPEDYEAIRRVYRALSIPEKMDVKDGGQVKSMPWASVIFDHAPIVAAGAMLTALKVDVLTAESQAADYFLSKIDAPSFNFNKIEPLAFSKTSYINRGDSIKLKVMIAAYDSTKDMKLQYWKNDSTYKSDNMLTFNGDTGEELVLKGDISGNHTIFGKTAIEIKGREEWVPWKFNYSVGEPTGTVSLPEMNVLYRGYPNKVMGAASGYPDYKLSSGGNVTITKGSNGMYIASPGSGREATIIIQGVSEDGTTAKLGDFKFRVNNMPKPSIYLGSLEDGSDAPSATIKSQSRLFAKYGPEIPLEANFTVKSWEVNVTGAPRPENGAGAALTPRALNLIKQARPGNTVSIMCTVVGPDGRARKSGGTFKVR